LPGDDSKNAHTHFFHLKASSGSIATGTIKNSK